MLTLSGPVGHWSKPLRPTEVSPLSIQAPGNCLRAHISPNLTLKVKPKT